MLQDTGISFCPKFHDGHQDVAMLQHHDMLHNQSICPLFSKSVNKTEVLLSLIAISSLKLDSEGDNHSGFLNALLYCSELLRQTHMRLIQQERHIPTRRESGERD